MRAKCPHCQDGCDKCDGGFTEVLFARGRLYTRHCTDAECGFDNGGVIVGPDARPESTLNTPPRDCVQCGAAVEWQRVGESSS